jgi:hypothetical protein
MGSIQEKHTAAMDLAESAFVAKLKGDLEQALQFTRQALIDVHITKCFEIVCITIFV